MSTIKKQYNTVVSKAKNGVSGFANVYTKFIEKVTINQSSKSLIVNYTHSLPHVAIEFNRLPARSKCRRIQQLPPSYDGA
jgi:hypothetical protein